ncbi:ATP-binding cassette domain-containing protein [Butyrivibrio sp. FC2001]|uniref:ATP-binding cassette domain-containing protein n=1 Tax=Butyrivibrio sp. FC2001 TaxID=1280671 RepID=UPI00040981A9|nr:ATP-binding cassette domain-containing protein [Butyrivibrio sp. FC2001]
MSWFDEQIKIRENADMEAFEDSCLRIAGSVMGKSLTAALHDERQQAKDAIGEVLKYYHVAEREIPEKLTSLEDILEYLLRPNGMMIREVTLREGWRKAASGAMLTTLKGSNTPLALIPAGMSGYKYRDAETGKYVRVTAAREKQIATDAIAFYKPFPVRKLGMRDVISYIWANIDKGSLYAYLGIFTLIALLGLIVPYITKSMFADVAVSGNMVALIAISIFMISVSLGRMLFGTIRDLFLERIALKLDQTVEAATMMRILALPTGFFGNYASGDLSTRINYMNLLVTQLINIGLSTGLTVLLSFIYIIQIFTFTPTLAVPALTVTLLIIIVTVMAVVVSTGINRVQMELAAKESGLAYALIAGIEKIKLSGAERRAFAKWGRAYSEQAVYKYDPPLFVKTSSVLITAISLIGTVIIYMIAIKTQVSIPEYYAFDSAFGMVSASFATFSVMVTCVAQIKPILEMVRPIMETVPEVAEDKPVIERLTGAVEVNNVTFRYDEDGPPVLDNLNLKIKPGQYVAITGKTGCGKSTLMRILLGFETPQRGAIYYDGKDIKSIDLKSLRSRIGTVMQNGSLFMGDIYANIVISNPELTLDDAWEAAELAGMADDIRRMPMGMFTMIAEGAGGISGGQKQRLMIARAIAPKPKILMFDEATSALDNITQKQVSDSLETLKCTRIVIAHRLSTIKNCDRIIVLDGGKIIEDGTYDELMKLNGSFAELVKRQQVETDEG